MRETADEIAARVSRRRLLLCDVFEISQTDMKLFNKIPLKALLCFFHSCVQEARSQRALSREHLLAWKGGDLRVSSYLPHPTTPLPSSLKENAVQPGRGRVKYDLHGFLLHR